MTQDKAIDLTDVADAGNTLEAIRALVPHLSDYFGPWAMLESRFRAIVDQVRSMNLTMHVAQTRAQAGDDERRPGGYTVRDGIATFRLTGSLMKRADSLSGGTSTIRARQQIREARRDALVEGGLLVIDSPGGTVAGTDDLATEVAAFAAEKPIDAFIEDLGASAAYYAASQARRVYANRSAQVGSIGTFGVVVDSSQQAEDLGLVVHVLRSGPFKGAGVPGEAISEEMLEAWQAEVDGFAAQFINAVATGRNRPRAEIEKVADGRVFFADEAQRLGLIDGVRRYDEVFAGLRRAIDDSRTDGDLTMTDGQANEPRAATYQEIVSACKGADSAFICACLEKGLTLESSRDAYVEDLAGRVKTAEESAAAAEEKAQQASAATGVEAATSTAAAAEPDLPVAEQFDAAVRAEMDRNDVPRDEAIRRVCRRNPELHKAFLIATNPNMRPQRMIEEKFDAIARTS